MDTFTPSVTPTRVSRPEIDVVCELTVPAAVLTRPSSGVAVPMPSAVSVAATRPVTAGTVVFESVPMLVVCPLTVPNVAASVLAAVFATPSVAVTRPSRGVAVPIPSAVSVAPTRPETELSELVCALTVPFVVASVLAAKFATLSVAVTRPSRGVAVLRPSAVSVATTRFVTNVTVSFVAALPSTVCVTSAVATVWFTTCSACSKRSKTGLSAPEMSSAGEATNVYVI